MNFIDAYQEPHRHYHNLVHIEDCLEQFRSIQDQVVNKYEMWLAIWFHDAVYSIAVGAQNEERSAQLAMDWMTDDASKTIVRNLILVTKHSPLYPPMTVDECIMCDIDLASLGASPEVFEKHCQAIRKEYSIYPDAVYGPGRIEIMQWFLKRKSIYYTAFFKNKYEAQARINIQAEIERLAL